MLKDQQIEELLTEVVGQVKASTGGIKPKPPEYNPVYQDCVEMREEICVHAAMHDFPERLFKAKAPNEDDAQFKYRKENYQPVTMPFWNRALQVLNRIWNDQNYGLTWPVAETDGQQQQDYFQKNYPEHKSIVSYFKQVVTRAKVNDPNAVLCIRPKYIPAEVDEAGELRILDTVRIEPEAVIYESPRVIKHEEGRYTMIELPEKSPVKFGNAIVMEGLIYELYDEENIYRIKQVGKKTDYEFETTVYYPHRLGFVPSYKLRGIPIEDNGRQYYKSYFYDAVPLLNTALYDSSTLEISKVGAAFPHRWAVTYDCDYQGCGGSGNIFQGEGADRKLVTCPSCKGSGKKSMFTPMGVFEVQPGNAINDMVPTPPFGFVGPPIDVLQFTHTQVEQNIVKAFAMLNIEVAASIAKGDETATGKLIDREELFSFLLTFASEIFDLLENAIKSIGLMRYGEAFKMPEIAAPVNFEIRGEKELTEEFKAATEAGLPDLVLRRIMREYIQIRFSDSADLLKKAELIMSADSLASYSAEDVLAQAGAGIVEKWEVILHNRIHRYIDDLVADKPDWMQGDLKKMREELIAKAKEEAAAMQKSFDTMAVLGRIGQQESN